MPGASQRAPNKRSIQMLHTNAERLNMDILHWGKLQWLANAYVFKGSTQTLGICQLYAGKQNPLHYHPNCDEILYVQQGTGKHLLGEEWIDVAHPSCIREPEASTRQRRPRHHDHDHCFLPANGAVFKVAGVSASWLTPPRGLSRPERRHEMASLSCPRRRQRIRGSRCFIRYTPRRFAAITSGRNAGCGQLLRDRQIERRA